MDNYEEQAQAFLDKTGAKITVEYKETAKYFDDDNESRDIYQITITRGARSYSFRFGQSINCSGKFHVLTNYAKQKLKTGTVTYAISRFADLIYGKDYKKNENFSAPSAYDVLSCVQKDDPGTFENFCSDFGYDTDSRKAEKTYNEVKEEYIQLSRLFTDTELEEMQEIQ